MEQEQAAKVGHQKVDTASILFLIPDSLDSPEHHIFYPQVHKHKEAEVVLKFIK